ncbi:MAG: PilZ domain-containing protein [Gammaproteobacteria bacterium]|nr:PilZ domain-containing protein [Gammaproteobacteria bacterium]
MSNAVKRRGAQGSGKTARPPPYESYEERRKYPRVHIDRPVEIRLGREALRAVIHDISPDGLQIRCDRKTMQAIRPSGSAIKGDDGPVIKVAFSLMIAGKEKPVETAARIYYFVLLPDEKPRDVSFGVQFLKLDKRSQADVDAFFREALEPVEDAIFPLLGEPRTVAEIADRLRMTPQRVNEALDKMKDTHHVIALQSGNELRYLQLAAALRVLFLQVADLDQRLRRIEGGKSRSQAG